MYFHSKYTGKFHVARSPRQGGAALSPRKLSKYQQREGVFTKASVLQNAQEMAPSAWWDLYGKHLPILTGVAKSVLAQVVCASAAERSNLSIYGQIKHKVSTRAAASSATPRATSSSTSTRRCTCATSCRRRATNKAKVEKWDSDSESRRLGRRGGPDGVRWQPHANGAPARTDGRTRARCARRFAW